MTYPWGHNRRFNSYTEYIRNVFGGRMQKVVVDAGFTCPNRDGSKGIGGCTYCNNDAFNPSYCNPEEDLHVQIAKGIEFHAVRYRRAQKFLVYFQPYSNSYAPLEKMKAMYEHALAYPDVSGLVIGTRPDCMDDKKLRYLQHLAQQWYIQVEYGIESCYDNTLLRINRGHDFKASSRMVKKTSEMGIRTGIHMIFGLPGETIEMMMQEAEILSALPIHGIKFHQLQIVKGTKMEQEFIRHPEDFHLFTLGGYIEFIVQFLEHLSPEIVVERFSGEVPPPLLHHTSWDLIRYDEVLRRIEAELIRRDTWQGKFYRKFS